MTTDTRSQAIFSVHPLKRERLKRNITQQVVADFTGLGTATIKRAESGKPVNADVRQRLCDYFGKTSDELGLCAAQVVRPQLEEVSEPLCLVRSLTIDPQVLTWQRCLLTLSSQN